MDAVDRAAELQQQLNESALAERRAILPPNIVCKKCGERNDRPQYAICTECFDSLQPA